LAAAAVAGLWVNGRLYSFLAYSSSQLKVGQQQGTSIDSKWM
jgi:hypothetical protein